MNFHCLFIRDILRIDNGEINFSSTYRFFPKHIDSIFVKHTVAMDLEM